MSTLEDLHTQARLKGFQSVIDDPTLTYGSSLSRRGALKQGYADAILMAKSGENSGEDKARNIIYGLADKIYNRKSNASRDAWRLLKGDTPYNSPPSSASVSPVASSEVSAPYVAPSYGDSGNNNSSGGSSGDGGSDVQDTAYALSGGNLARSFLRDTLTASDSTKAPWATNQDLMDKISGYRPTNTKDIAYRNLMDNLPSLVSGGSWFSSVNERMKSLSGLLQKAQSDSLVESANIDDAVRRNSIANDVYSSMRNGQMTNPQEYTSLMKMLENIGAGKYNSADVGNLFLTPSDQLKAKTSASTALISDDNHEKDRQTQMYIASLRQASGGGKASSDDKLGRGIFETVDYANKWGANLKDPKDVDKIADTLKKAFVTAQSHSPEAVQYVAQAGIKFAQAHGRRDDANVYARALGVQPDTGNNDSSWFSSFW